VPFGCSGKDEVAGGRAVEIWQAMIATEGDEVVVAFTVGSMEPERHGWIVDFRVGPRPMSTLGAMRPRRRWGTRLSLARVNACPSGLWGCMYRPRKEAVSLRLDADVLAAEEGWSGVSDAGEPDVEGEDARGFAAGVGSGRGVGRRYLVAAASPARRPSAERNGLRPSSLLHA
jgi:hypothetical protein